MHWPEADVWKMTPYKITTLFGYHKKFNPDRFVQDTQESVDDIDVALGGL